MSLVFGFVRTRAWTNDASPAHASNVTATSGVSGLGPQEIEACRQQAMHAFGTAEIFRQRYATLKGRVRTLDFLGVAVPAGLGASVGLIGLESPAWPWILGLTGALAFFELIGSIWSLVSGWTEAVGYSRESMGENSRLYECYKGLGARANATQTEYAVLEAERLSRERLDDQAGISPAEKRLGMRAALHQWQVACRACKSIPSGVHRSSSDCSVCGR